MAEAILRAILERPERCPNDLLETAKTYRTIWPKTRPGDVWSWQEFKKTLAKYSGKLPEILETGKD